MITYWSEFGLYWPTYDHNPPKCHHKVQHQIWAMDLTIERCKGKQLCIQAGGHVGLWPKRLAQTFEKVITFEPDPACFAAMEKNLEGIANIEMHPLALSDGFGTVRMMQHRSAGSWTVNPEGQSAVQTGPIDYLKVDACDAIILDIEGHEPEALEGAAETIRKFRPVLHVEVLGRVRERIEAFMKAMDYKRAALAHADEIFVPA